MAKPEGSARSDLWVIKRQDAYPSVKGQNQYKHINKDSNASRNDHGRWNGNAVLASLAQIDAKTTAEILERAGYDATFIARVSFLIEKKLLKKDEETQLLEDVICLVFLDYYLAPFVEKHDTEKLKNIILKTWNKMSEYGHQAALKIKYSSANLDLIKEALGL